MGRTCRPSCAQCPTTPACVCVDSVALLRCVHACAHRLPPCSYHRASALHLGNADTTEMYPPGECSVGPIPLLLGACGREPGGLRGPSGVRSRGVHGSSGGRTALGGLQPAGARPGSGGGTRLG